MPRGRRAIYQWRNPLSLKLSHVKNVGVEHRISHHLFWYYNYSLNPPFCLTRMNIHIKSSDSLSVMSTENTINPRFFTLPGYISMALTRNPHSTCCHLATTTEHLPAAVLYCDWYNRLYMSTSVINGINPEMYIPLITVIHISCIYIYTFS